MTKENQKALVADFANSIVEEFNQKIGQVPENWDGHELRCWLADTAFDAARPTIIRRSPRSKRAKDYKITLLSTNL